jgi:hypothetical protein
MADTQSDTELIVTLRSILGPGHLESARRPETAKPIDPVREAAIIGRYNSILEKLQEETDKTSDNVFITVQDRDASLLQSCIAENAEGGQPLSAGGLEAKFGEGAAGGDIWGWFDSWFFDHIEKERWHPIKRPLDDNAASLPNTGDVAVVGDWGTNLYGAPVSAATIERRGNYALLLHLGDIYYSGTKSEAKRRFLDAWPKKAGKISRALNGNHEMYSGGCAYFDDILPAFDQPSSYFAMQNKHWLLVGLDTAHTNHALDAEQVTWLKSVLKRAGPRKVILFSHHQPFSRLAQQGPRLQAALADLLEKKAVTAWYWGHEHQCIIYERHKQFDLLGRCIGHGGIPSPRMRQVMDAPTKIRTKEVTWHQLSADANSPACLVLDGPNPLVKGEEFKFGPHGFLTLEFNGPQLTERVHLPDGSEIFKGQVG